MRIATDKTPSPLTPASIEPATMHKDLRSRPPVLSRPMVAPSVSDARLRSERHRAVSPGCCTRCSTALPGPPCALSCDFLALVAGCRRRACSLSPASDRSTLLCIFPPLALLCCRSRGRYVSAAATSSSTTSRPASARSRSAAMAILTLDLLTAGDARRQLAGRLDLVRLAGDGRRHGRRRCARPARRPAARPRRQPDADRRHRRRRPSTSRFAWPAPRVRAACGRVPRHDAGRRPRRRRAAGARQPRRPRGDRAAHGVSNVVIGFPEAIYQRDARVRARAATRSACETNVVPRFSSVDQHQTRFEYLGTVPLLNLRATNPRAGVLPSSTRSTASSRRSCSPLLSPLLLAIALARARSPPPARSSSRQPRAGRDGRVFDLLKFRTMTIERRRRRIRAVDPGMAPGGVEGVDRRTRDRAVPAPDVARRAAAADQRPARRDEPRRPAPRAPRVRRALPARRRALPRPPPRAGRHHRLGAGARLCAARPR